MSKVPAQSYEAMISRLEEIVNELGKSNIELSKSLSLFEEGVKLAGDCNRLLDDAQQKVTILTKKESGEISQEDFAIQE